MTRRKYPSGQRNTTGVVIEAFSDDKTAAKEE
jgi:hypothetical protein